MSPFIFSFQQTSFDRTCLEPNSVDDTCNRCESHQPVRVTKFWQFSRLNAISLFPLAAAIAHTSWSSDIQEYRETHWLGLQIAPATHVSMVYAVNENMWRKPYECLRIFCQFKLQHRYRQRTLLCYLGCRICWWRGRCFADLLGRSHRRWRSLVTKLSVQSKPKLHFEADVLLVIFDCWSHAFAHDRC